MGARELAEARARRIWEQNLRYAYVCGISVLLIGLAWMLLRSPTIRRNPFGDLPSGVGPPDPTGVRWLSGTLTSKKRSSRRRSRDSEDGSSKDSDPKSKSRDSPQAVAELATEPTAYESARGSRSSAR